MSVLRSRLDVILVMDEDGTAVQYEIFTTLRDQLELAKRWQKIAESGSAEAGIKLVFLAAERCGIVAKGISFDDFVDKVLDFLLSEAPPLTKG